MSSYIVFYISFDGDFLKFIKQNIECLTICSNLSKYLYADKDRFIK